MGEIFCHERETWPMSWTVDSPIGKRGGLARSDPINGIGYFIKYSHKHSDVCCPPKLDIPRTQKQFLGRSYL